MFLSRFRSVSLPKIGLVFIFILAFNKSLAAEYDVRINSISENGSELANFVCFDHVFCRRQIVGVAASNELNMVALFSPGNMFARFEENHQILSLGEQDYLHMNIGEIGKTSRDIFLFEQVSGQSPSPPENALRYPNLKTPIRPRFTFRMTVTERH